MKPAPKTLAMMGSVDRPIHHRPRFLGVLLVLGASSCIGLPPFAPAQDGSGGSDTGMAVATGSSRVDTGDSSTGPDVELDSSGTGLVDGVCGDELVEGNEECDQGADNGTGGSCTSECRNNVCGDGYVGPGEACDDGNDDDEDLCTSSCGPATCGDGAIQGAEQCDEGPDNTETGSCLPSCIAASCGDLFIQSGVEACDGVNTGAETCQAQGFDDGVLVCTDDCTTFDTSNCHACGNGIIEVNEICDGDNFGMESCQTFAPMGTMVSGGALSCIDNCMTIDIGPCTYCGDDIREGMDEECDGADFGGQTCGTVLGMGSQGMLSCTPDCFIDHGGCCLALGASCMDNAECCSNVCTGDGNFCSDMLMPIP